MATSSISLLLMLNILCLCSTRDVYIQPSEGEHCPGTPCYNINTFGEMADSFSNSSGLVVHFLEGTHLLDLQELVVFRNLTNAVFDGDGRMEQGFHETVWQSTVVIKCTEYSSTGIAFVNSSNITFRYITITNCRPDKIKHSYVMKDRSFSASLTYFNVSESVEIDHVSVQNGSGSGLLAISMGANLTITNSSFAQNGYYSLLILHFDPENCTSQKEVHKTLIVSNTNVSFCNQGGLVIGMSQGSYYVSIALDYVTAYGNVGFYGNIFISALEHKVPTYNLTINNTLSTHGTSALMISSLYSNITFDHSSPCHNSPDQLVNLTILIVNCKFNHNNHYQVNEVMVFELVGVTFTTKITMESTEISHNIGSGVLFYLLSNEQQVQLYARLSNVTAKYNSHPSNRNAYTISANSVTALTLHNVSIINNNMTGLDAYHTAVVVDGTSVFHNNTGYNGGGLALYSDSFLVFRETCFLNFTNNKARHKGGAIYVSEKHITHNIIVPCFFQYSNFTLPKMPKAFFSGNTADTAGTVLFGGEISTCISYNFKHVCSIEQFNKTFNYSAQTGPSVISSKATDVCFCDDNNTINCSQIQLTMSAYPGEEISISVVTVGKVLNEDFGVSPADLELHPSEEGEVNLHKMRSKSCTNIKFTPIYKAYMLKVSGKNNFKLLNISYSNCSLDFENSSKITLYCDCKKLKHVHTVTNNITCDAATNTITRQGDIWIGNISNCVVVHTPCPFDYCNSAHVSFFLTDPDPQCAPNRTGILCSKCQDGLSLALGSNNCIQCTQFSYLALIIPFAAAGFGLVALLMVLNLTVSIGTINGLIFYASIVKISESTGIYFPNGPIPVLSQFIAWLNLDLGIETCFYPGMTAYSKVWLQFVFPLYIWFIIATIIVLCRYSTWLSNKIGGNVVQVFATLILLSFEKVFHTIALIIKPANLACVIGKKYTHVWYMDGNILYLSPEHAVLMVAAVLFLLIAVPYTLALLFCAVIEKYLTRIKFFRNQWIKFKPFIDAYHGPYKDNCRFWTGLLLLVRMLFTLIALFSNSYITLIFVTTSTSVLLSLMAYLGGVYQNNYLNILEWSSLINLILLSAIYSSLQNFAVAQQVVSIISVCVALVTFVGVIFFHVFIRTKSNNCFKKLASIKLIRTKTIKKYNLSEDEEETSFVFRPLVRPTSTDACMKRESLINSK